MGRTQTANEQSALRPAFAGVHATRSLLKIEAWMPSEIKAISPLVKRLMRLIEGSRYVHGNRMDAHKLVQIRCQCELGKGVSIVVTDQGQGFDPKAVPDPLTVERLEAEHGRGIHLMKLAMDEIWFERRGSEVHMQKGPAGNPRTDLRGNNKTDYLGSFNNIQRSAVLADTQTHARSRHEE